MLDVYPVYLKLGWKHSVSCVSRTRTDRNTVTAQGREAYTHTSLTRLTLHAYTINRRIADSLKLPEARSSASHSASESSESSSLSWRSTSALHPASCMRSCTCRACHVSLRATRSLCVSHWLCIWCISASKSETHRYTRIRTPHPVYLTSRCRSRVLRPEYLPRPSCCGRCTR